MQHEAQLKPEMTQVSPDLVCRQPTMTAAILLCQTLSGLEDKQLVGARGIVKDPAQWTRIKNGQHHFPQDRLNLLMDTCGNEVPLMWLAQSRGYSLTSLETETERRLRLERERSAELEKENALLRSLIGGKA